MASIAPFPPVSGNGFLSTLRGAQPAGARLAYLALSSMRRPAPGATRSTGRELNHGHVDRTESQGTGNLRF
jgi:hypothetical protein